MQPGRPLLRIGCVLLAVLGLVLAQAPLASASPLIATTYADARYSGELLTLPTQSQSQSKLWFHDGSWWGLLADPAGRTLRVNTLMPDHTWKPTSTVVNPDAADTGDALQDGNVVHVVTRHSDGSLIYVRLTYDPAAHTYAAAAPTSVSTRVSQAPASIAKDASGRLWVSFATAATVLMTFSNDDGRTWAPNNALFYASTGLTAQISGLVTFGDKVGLLWSDQPGQAFKFAWHSAANSPYAWTRETALAGRPVADAHLDLVRVPGPAGDSVVAAIKTARKDGTDPPDKPMITLLMRDPAGHWSTTPVSTVADGMDHPVLQVDATNKLLYVIGSAFGGIAAKQAPLDHLSFAPGAGDTFMLDPAGSGSTSLSDPTVSKEPVSAASGLVVLASDTHLRLYRHGEMAIVPPKPIVDPNDHTPPTPPGALQGHAVSSDTVVLSWVAATDGTQWVPAATGVPVAGYTISRDGQDLGTVAETSFQDRVRTGNATASARSVHYQVQAVDAAGNKSAPVQVVVSLPAAASTQSATTGIGLWVLAALLVLLWVGRRIVVRRDARRERLAAGERTPIEAAVDPAPAEPAEPAEPQSVGAPV